MKRGLITVKAVCICGCILISCGSTNPGNRQNAAVSPASASSRTGAQYYSGDGGNGITIAVLEPQGVNLAQSDKDAELTGILQGDLTTSLQKYSGMTLVDRQNQDARLAEINYAEQGYTTEADAPQIGRELNVKYIVTGSVTLTPAQTYNLQFSVTNVEEAKVSSTFSLPGISADALYNLSAGRQAAQSLLKGLGVNLTDIAITELNGVTAAQINAQAAAAKGIAALAADPTSVTGIAYMYQAAAFDSSYMQTANNASIAAANIDSGNIGADARADVAWRNSWKQRLEETENYFSNFFAIFNQPYALVYDPTLEESDLNYDKGTMSLSFVADFLEYANWTSAIPNTVNSVLTNLKATGRADAWGFSSWPSLGVSDKNPFSRYYNNNIDSKTFRIIAELYNAKNERIGSSTFSESGYWEFTMRDSSFLLVSDTSDQQTIVFENVDVNKITDSLTIKFATINGIPADQAGKDGLVWITTRDAYRDSDGYNYYGVADDGRIYGGLTTAQLEVAKAVMPYLVVFYGDICGFARNFDYSNIDIDTFYKKYSNYVIPAIINGKRVTGIKHLHYKLRDDDFSFSSSRYTEDHNHIIGNRNSRVFYTSRVSSIVIPESITNIHWSAFYGTISMITIGANVSISDGIDNDFAGFYNSNGKKSGVYTYKKKGWSYKAK